jgi:phage tail-like protein
MKDNHPLPAFHFRVVFKGLKGAGDTDSRFQSISGLKALAVMADTVSSDLHESKKNNTIFNPLVLRRAVSTANNSALSKWLLKSLNKSSSDPLPEVLIEVLNETHKVTLVFRLTHVTAAGWELGELNAQKSELLMEEITLHYTSIELLSV